MRPRHTSPRPRTIEGITRLLIPHRRRRRVQPESAAATTTLHTVDFDRGDIGVRVDLVLLRHLGHEPQMSRARIQRWIASGRVTINGRPVPRVAWRIATGDRLCVDMHDVRRREVPRGEPVPVDVIYEDAHLLAVNKPAGLVVHPSYKHDTGTLLNGLLHRAAQWTSGDTPALLTRLDKMTSGVLLVAKRAEVVAALQRDMRAQRIDKDYLAVVHGVPAPARGTITLALDRDPWDRRRVTVTDRGGQPAVTRYERLAVSPVHETGDDARRLSLVRCRLVTGRMHQLRVHLSHKGWPIAGDPTYGRAVTPGRGRQALHAWRLSLTHPVTGEALSFEAPLPDDLQALLRESGIAWPPPRRDEDSASGSGDPAPDAATADVG